MGTIVAFAAYLRMLYTPMASLMNSRVEVVTALVSFERVFEVVDLPIEVDDILKCIETYRKICSPRSC